MKKFIIFSLFFLAVFVLLIFQSSFCWAFDSEIVVNLSDFGLSSEYVINFPSSVTNYEDLNYFYIRDYGSNQLIFCFSEQPMYYVTTTDIAYVDNSLILSGYIDTTTGVYYITTESANQMTTFDMGFSNDYLKMGNGYLYSDSSLTNIVTPINYVYNENLVVLQGSSDMFSVVNDISSSLGIDTLFSQVENSIPLIVLSVLFVLGFALFLRLLIRIPKGKLKV